MLFIKIKYFKALPKLCLSAASMLVESRHTKKKPIPWPAKVTADVSFSYCGASVKSEATMEVTEFFLN